MRRGLPSFRRLLIEYAIVFVIIYGVAILADNLIIGLIAGVVAMLLLRMTRPKASNGGPGRREGPGAENREAPSKDAPPASHPPEKT
jgi:hypothetical protein